MKLGLRWLARRSDRVSSSSSERLAAVCLDTYYFAGIAGCFSKNIGGLLVSASLPHHPAKTAQSVDRLHWLDGARGIAAFYVVLHHVYLTTYGGFPASNGPWFVGWLLYGHLAVAAFIVISGFSLTISLTSNGLRTKNGDWAFLVRRFWRIVPPYWFALALASALVLSGLITTPSGQPLQVRDIIIHALLLQDTFANVPPNGVFWSIAVEWHIYFLFPLLLWGFRRFGAMPTVALTALVVISQNVLAQHVGFVALFDRFTPQFLLLFVFGMVAAVYFRHPRFSYYAALLSLAITVGLAVGIPVIDSPAIVANYFSVDIIFGLAVMGAFMAVASGNFRALRGALSWAPIVAVGEFAFSLYLVHAPILSLVSGLLIQPNGWTGGTAFWVMLAVGTPLAVVASYVFFLLFERPFLRVRTWSDFAQGFARKTGEPVQSRRGASSGN